MEITAHSPRQTSCHRVALPSQTSSPNTSGKYCVQLQHSRSACSLASCLSAIRACTCIRRLSICCSWYRICRLRLSSSSSCCCSSSLCCWMTWFCCSTIPTCCCSSECVCCMMVSFCCMTVCVCCSSVCVCCSSVSFCHSSSRCWRRVAKFSSAALSVPSRMSLVGYRPAHRTER